MTILPLGKKLQLQIDEPSVGALDLSSKPSTTEYGTIVAMGEEAVGVSVGDKIMFKAWSVDIVNYNNENFYFIDADSEGLCALIKE